MALRTKPIHSTAAFGLPGKLMMRLPMRVPQRARETMGYDYWVVTHEKLRYLADAVTDDVLQQRTR
jgi:hypothetical protein